MDRKEKAVQSRIWGRVDKFLGKHNLKLTQKETDDLNSPISTKETPTKKTLGPDTLTGEYYYTIKEEITPIIHKAFRKQEGHTSYFVFWGQHNPDTRQTFWLSEGIIRRKENYRLILPTHKGVINKPNIAVFTLKKYIWQNEICPRNTRWFNM